MEYFISNFVKVTKLNIYTYAIHTYTCHIHNQLYQPRAVFPQNCKDMINVSSSTVQVVPVDW